MSMISWGLLWPGLAARPRDGRVAVSIAVLISPSYLPFLLPFFALLALLGLGLIRSGGRFAGRRGVRSGRCRGPWSTGSRGSRSTCRRRLRGGRGAVLACGGSSPPFGSGLGGVLLLHLLFHLLLLLF